MSDVNFRPSEIRLATATLCAVAAILPAAYYFYQQQPSKQAPIEHVQTFQKFIQSYSSLRPQALTTSASRDFSHTVFPASLQLPSRKLQPFQEHAEQVFELFTDFQMIPQSNGAGDSVHFSRATNTVVAQCNMGGKIDVDSEMGKNMAAAGLTEWWTECVLFVRLSEDGKRIEEVREFVDSRKGEELKIRSGGVLVE